MSSSVTETPALTSNQLPVAAIICIAIGAYIVFIILILVIRQLLIQRGFCAQCEVCGKEGDPCCVCCIVCLEKCNCCASPNCASCLDAICPCKRQQLDCADIITCQCCADPNSQCCSCCGSEPCCDQCCADGCTCDCETINCCCCQIVPNAPRTLAQASADVLTQQPTSQQPAYGQSRGYPTTQQPLYGQQPGFPDQPRASMQPEYRRF